LLLEIYIAKEFAFGVEAVKGVGGQTGQTVVVLAKIGGWGKGGVIF
jgi:hypothetical protein